MKSFFQSSDLVFEILAKNRNYSNELKPVNIDQIVQIAMCFTSMNLFRQALQINGKLFVKFKFRFQIIG